MASTPSIGKYFLYTGRLSAKFAPYSAINWFLVVASALFQELIFANWSISVDSPAVSGPGSDLEVSRLSEHAEPIITTQKRIRASQTRQEARLRVKECM